MREHGKGRFGLLTFMPPLYRDAIEFYIRSRGECRTAQVFSLQGVLAAAALSEGLSLTASER